MNKKDTFFALMIVVFLALLFSLFTSPWPDGLERVAKDKAFLQKGEVGPALNSPIPDYICPGLKNKKLATSAAGVVGILVVFGMGYGIAALLKRYRIK